jgi:hypothetical protein
LYKQIPNFAVSDLKAEVVCQKFKDDSKERECMFHSLPFFVGEMIINRAQYTYIDTPQQIVDNIMKKCCDVRKKL